MALSDRLKQLIGVYWDGDIQWAAEGTGVPPATLYRMVNGTTANPRAGAVAKVARACHTTVEWLLTGAGEPPVTTDKRGFEISFQRRRFERLVDGLNLSKATRHLVAELPFGPSSLTMGVWRALGAEYSGGPPLKARAAASACAGAWADTLEALIRRYGKKDVRRALEHLKYHIAWGLTPTADHFADRAYRPMYQAVAKETDKAVQHALEDRDRIRRGIIYGVGPVGGGPRATPGRSRRRRREG